MFMTRRDETRGARKCANHSEKFKNIILQEAAGDTEGTQAMTM